MGGWDGALTTGGGGGRKKFGGRGFRGGGGAEEPTSGGDEEKGLHSYTTQARYEAPSDNTVCANCIWAFSLHQHRVHQGATVGSIVAQYAIRKYVIRNT